jgi:hypothetical protein
MSDFVVFMVHVSDSKTGSQKFGYKHQVEWQVFDIVKLVVD